MSSQLTELVSLSAPPVADNCQVAPRKRSNGEPGERKPVPKIYERIGANIAAERKKSDLTRAQFVERLGWSTSFLSLVEAGRRRVTIYDINEIAKILGISPQRLLKNVWD